MDHSRFLDDPKVIDEAASVIDRLCPYARLCDLKIRCGHLGNEPFERPDEPAATQ